MKLAVKKDGGELQGLGGYHYMLVPFPMEDDKHAELWALMGHEIVEIDDQNGARLLRDAREALRHQVEVAYLVDGPKSATGQRP